MYIYIYIYILEEVERKFFASGSASKNELF